MKLFLLLSFAPLSIFFGLVKIRHHSIQSFFRKVSGKVKEISGDISFLDELFNLLDNIPLSFNVHLRFILNKLGVDFFGSFKCRVLFKQLDILDEEEIMNRESFFQKGDEGIS